MVTEYWSGHIPAFGEWEKYTNIVPSTRHFECRYEREHTVDMMYTTTVGFHKPLPHRVLRTAPAPQPKETVRGTVVNKGCRSTCKEPRRRAANQQQPFTRNQSHYYYSNNSNDIVTGSKPAIANLSVKLKVKPVDEDLYKISPELLKKSNSKKILGFFSRCIFPMCSA